VSEENQRVRAMVVKVARHTGPGRGTRRISDGLGSCLSGVVLEGDIPIDDPTNGYRGCDV
jgi:hypothetical protein